MRLLLLIALFPIYTQAQKLKPLSYYASHPAVSSEAKQFYKKLAGYQRNKASYNNESMEIQMSSIVDSLLSDNNQTRPFYFYLVNRALDLGNEGVISLIQMKQYDLFRAEPGYFFQYMIDNPAEKNLYYYKWIGAMKAHSAMECEYSTLNTDSCMRKFTAETLDAISPKYGHVKQMTKDFMKKVYTSPYDRAPLLITKESHGLKLSVAEGQTIKARFRECRGCASIWKIDDADTSKVESVTHEYGNPSCVNCSGGEHDHTIVFKLKYMNDTSITFTYFEEKITVTFKPYQ